MQTFMQTFMHVCYSFTITLSGLFELYTRGGYLQPQGKAEWFKSTPQVYNQVNHDEAKV